MQISRTEYETKEIQIQQLKERAHRQSKKLDLLYILLFFGVPIVVGFTIWHFDLVSRSDITDEHGIACVKVFDNVYCD